MTTSPHNLTSSAGDHAPRIVRTRFLAESASAGPGQWLLAAAIIASSLVGPLHAETVRWTGAAGDKRWENKNNWTKLNAQGQPQGAPAAAPGSENDGGPYEVLIPGSSGTITITASGAKNLKSLNMATGGAITTITSSRAASGEAIEIELNAEKGFHIGMGHRIIAASSGVGPMAEGFAGGSVTLKSTDGAIVLDSSAMIVAGKGGGGANVFSGAGGDIMLIAKTLVRCTKGRIVAGDSGSSPQAFIPQSARGGNINIVVTDGDFLNVGWGDQPGVRAGDGVARGGHVSITAKNIINNMSFAKITAGSGTMLGAAGGDVTLVAIESVQNTGDVNSGDQQSATIRAGNGGPASPQHRVSSGKGGRVTILAATLLNGVSPTGQLRPGQILGGQAGIGETPTPAEGGSVAVFASTKARVGKILAGKGRTGNEAGKPHGDLTVVSPNIYGVVKAFGDEVKLVGAAGLLAAASTIDLAGLGANAVEGITLVCLNTDGGTIKLKGSAAGAVTCDGGFGEIVINAEAVELTGFAQPVALNDAWNQIVNLMQGLVFADAKCSAQPCVGDVDGNGVVDAADLALLLQAWLTNNAAFDLNDDGKVDGADLALALGNWGDCDEN
ncbi:MAG: hypothetical protein KF724_03485 [Phycisphaeraceae bacterium]|nr:hypothetical protein [Phycisphaeraceae bacterium]